MSDQRKPPIEADVSSSTESTSADRLRALLQRAHLSQRAAARLLGVDERTMRMWCTGQGEPPVAVYRALSPKLTDLEYLYQTIEQNEKLIDAMEAGRFAEIPRDYRPSDAVAAKREIEHLRKRNEEHKALVRLEEATDWRREAHALVFAQWAPRGTGVPTEESLDDLDHAEEEFRSAKAVVDRITEEIRMGRRSLGNGFPSL